MAEILIIGAGPAGSSMAKFAAEQGFDVSIVDAGTTSTLWSKPCGNGLVKRAVDITKIKPPSGKELYAETKFVRTYSPDMSFKTDIVAPVYLINRNEFGKRIMKDAVKAGANFIEKTTFTKPIIEGGHVRGATFTNGKKNLSIRANLVVDATGYLARLKSQLPKDWPVSENPAFRWLCYRGILEVKNVKDPNYLKIYLNQDISPKGYVWNFPHGKNQINFGLGVSYKYAKDLVNNYNKLKSKLAVKKVIHEAGAPIPMSRPPLSLVGPGVLVLGDAAPTIDPTTGEGIGPSIESAYFAASKLKEVAESGWTYEASWAMNDYMRKVGANLASKDVLRELVLQVDTKTLQKFLSISKNRLSLLKL
ncbi:MAG: NAD(P)/FAD-dependent oxidoreductase, partial [Candidatus Altiarchaeota archaeon]|nr:NAD(P)/FAD-dependent oxidoreductase [Candidatus Altiarchaeota archaeon]